MSDEFKSLDQAVVAGIIATAALQPGAKVDVKPPTGTVEQTRAAYLETEELLRNSTSLSVRAESPVSPRGLAFHPAYGLALVDKSGTGRDHWAGCPDGVLAQHSPLLVQLRSAVMKAIKKENAQILKVSADAKVETAAEKRTADVTAVAIEEIHVEAGTAVGPIASDGTFTVTPAEPDAPMSLVERVPEEPELADIVDVTASPIPTEAIPIAGGLEFPDEAWDLVLSKLPDSPGAIKPAKKKSKRSK